MDLSNPPTTIRHDGWTAARRIQFLEALAEDGNVRAASARVGMSRAAAYFLRRREPLFARAWAAAQLQARERVGEVLGTRAIEGIEEQVWHRGEVVGTRLRYDTRLLLAHMARLDKLAEDERAVEDAGRFDELLACVAGEPVPEELAVGPGELPVCREDAALMYADLASDEAPADDRYAARCRGTAEGHARWDTWHASACDAVDRLRAEPARWTVSNVSTSTHSSPDRGGGPPQVGEGHGQF
jgi:hypothetical protein